MIKIDPLKRDVKHMRTVPGTGRMSNGTCYFFGVLHQKGYHFHFLFTFCRFSYSLHNMSFRSSLFSTKCSKLSHLEYRTIFNYRILPFWKNSTSYCLLQSCCKHSIVYSVWYFLYDPTRKGSFVRTIFFI